MKTVSLEQVGHEELSLPPRVQEALGELVGSAREGLLALSVGVGLGVLVELLEEEVVGVVGPKGHDPERTAVRHGARVGRGDARRAARAGGAAACAQRRRRRGGAACDVRVLRRPRSVDEVGV
jgi:hypothetical protein